MKKTNFAIATTLVAALFASTAHAQEARFFYVGVGVGQSTVSFNSEDFNASSSPSATTTVDASSKTKVAYNLSVGYQFTPNVAVEVSYLNLGSPVYGYAYNAGSANSTLKLAGLGVAAIGKWQIADSVALLGGAGVVSYTANRDPYHSWGTNPAASSKTGVVPQIIVGAEYALSKQLALQARYTSYGVMGDAGSVGRVTPSAYALGLQYSFR